MTRNVTAVSATDSQRFPCLCLLLHYFIKTHEPCTKVSVSSDSRRHYRSMMGDSHTAARQSCHSDRAKNFRLSTVAAVQNPKIVDFSIWTYRCFAKKTVRVRVACVPASGAHDLLFVPW